MVTLRGMGIKKGQVVRNGRKAKVTGGMSADLIPSHMVGMRGTQKHMPGRPDGALSTACGQSQRVLLVPALRERRLAIPALRSEEDGSACT